MKGVLRAADFGLPADFDRLLDAATAATAYRDAGVAVDRADPTYIRLKPGTGALVGYAVQGRAEDGSLVSLPGYARTFVDRSRTETIAAKWTGSRPVRTPFGPGFGILEGGHTVLFVFPNDGGLRGLRKLDRVLARARDLLPGDAGHTYEIHSLTPIRYKPERRFIASLQLGPTIESGPPAGRMFLRLFPDDRGDRILRATRVIQNVAGASVVPEPRGTVLDGQVYLEEEVSGEEVLGPIAEGRADPMAIADALRRFHACREPMGIPRAPDAILPALDESLEAVGVVDPALMERARELTRTLRRLIPPGGSLGAVHGDLSLHNILLSPRGPVLVDLERAGVGHPLEDIGQFVGHLRNLASRRPDARQNAKAFEEELVEAYARLTGTKSLDGLKFFTACALAERAVAAVLRRQLDDWEEDRAERLLELALDSVAQTTSFRRAFLARPNDEAVRERWEVLYPKPEGEWPVVVEDSAGTRVYGTYDPRKDAFREVRPEDDEGLPALARWLDKGRLINYRVGRRATVAVPGDAPTAYVKILPPRKAQKVVRRYQALHQLVATAPAGVPRPPELLDWLPEDGVIMLGAVPGGSLRDALLESPTEAQGALQNAARGVAVLHALPCSEFDAPAVRPPMTMRQYANFAIDFVPERVADYRRALELLEANAPIGPQDESRLVHGDLHDGNVLLNGTVVTLIDLDMLHLGHPVEDVGNLVAHLFLRALQAGAGPEVGRTNGEVFLNAYARAGGRVDREAARRRGASSLFRLSCLYVFRGRWRALTPLLLDEAVRWTTDPAGKADEDRRIGAALGAPRASSVGTRR